MKVVITGASGFVGPYLAKELIGGDHEIILTSPFAYSLSHAGKSYDAKVCNLIHSDDVIKLIKQTKPDAVAHLAGYSHVGKAWQERTQLIEGNVFITHNLLSALCQLEKPVKFLFVSSAQVFKTGGIKNQLNETSLTWPDSPYGATKLASENLVRSYMATNIKPVIVRPFNHIGPGQHQDFVCPSLAKRIINAQQNDSIAVGNLTAKRDFTDVRDMVRAYRLVVEYDGPEDLFVLGSGRAVDIETVFHYFIKLSKKNITPLVNESLIRENDPELFVADATLAKEKLGWLPEIPLEKTLQDIFEHEKSYRLNT